MPCCKTPSFSDCCCALTRNWPAQVRAGRLRVRRRASPRQLSAQAARLPERAFAPSFESRFSFCCADVPQAQDIDVGALPRPARLSGAGGGAGVRPGMPGRTQRRRGSAPTLGVARAHAAALAASGGPSSFR
ncbi:MAG: hypothetical protein MZW92_74165 [Comamonadaceae bacterium]|nr:hypothetical protein [Comamonadaceae bacterium]